MKHAESLIGLRHRADVRAVVVVLLTLATLAYGWLESVRSPWFLLAAGVGTFTVNVINHNHQHVPVFVGRWPNAIFGAWIALATGQPAKAIVPIHVANHHVHTNDDRDPANTRQMRWRWNALNLLLYPVRCAKNFRRVKRVEFSRWGDAHPRAHRQLVLERWVLYPALGVLCLVAPLDTLVNVGLPWLAGQWAIIAMNLLQHDGCDAASPWNHSRNFVSPYLNWWFFNAGYHTAHHRFPGAHWTRLRDLDHELAPRMHPRLRSTSLVRTLVRFYVWPARRAQVTDLHS